VTQILTQVDSADLRCQHDGEGGPANAKAPNIDAAPLTVPCRRGDRQKDEIAIMRETAPVDHAQGLQRGLPRERHLRAAQRRQRPGRRTHLVGDPAFLRRPLASALGETGDRLLKRFVAQEHPDGDCREHGERSRQTREIGLRPRGKERLHQCGGWPEHDPRRAGLGDVPDHQHGSRRPVGSERCTSSAIAAATTANAEKIAAIGNQATRLIRALAWLSRARARVTPVK
jgi:hypothetical protein